MGKAFSKKKSQRVGRNKNCIDIGKPQSQPAEAFKQEIQPAEAFKDVKPPADVSEEKKLPAEVVKKKKQPAIVTPEVANPHAVQIIRQIEVIGDSKPDVEKTNVEVEVKKQFQSTGNLAAILLDDKVADKPVAIVSVAGAYRKGKSFSNNFMIRYLQHLEAGSSNDAADWLGGEDDELEGFEWRNGVERVTTGIHIWSHPFLVRREDGTKVVVLLMDTQGTFDSHSTVKDCATVFALSTLLSSVQIYNVSQNIQNDHLQHLQLFSEYGRLAIEKDGKDKPFQTLVFLVRDWSYPYDAPYGFEGGEKTLNECLQVCEGQDTELKQLRQHIHCCFDDMKCFLLPHPGMKVATKKDFRGKLRDIEDEFKAELRVLIPALLSPTNIRAKRINGQEVTCRELLYYVGEYVKSFQSQQLPEPSTIYNATAVANNAAAVSQARTVYINSMKKLSGGDEKHSLLPEALYYAHCFSWEKALNAFNKNRKMGGDDFSAPYRKQLLSDIEENYDGFRSSNDQKKRSERLKRALVIGGTVAAGATAVAGGAGLCSVNRLCFAVVVAGATTVAKFYK